MELQKNLLIVNTNHHSEKKLPVDEKRFNLQN
jgi:hypothetical protein